MSSDYEDTYITNELDLPVKVLGISNPVFAVSVEAFLVTDKLVSSRMKEMLNDGLFARGCITFLTTISKTTQKFFQNTLHEDTGKNVSFQYQHFRRVTWTIISSKGRFIQNGIWIEVW
ncbi:hypothetical protein [Paenibacillus oryzisoli]|nr:hypothetical protein [Paenibacillus oryzisoli]